MQPGSSASPSWWPRPTTACAASWAGPPPASSTTSAAAYFAHLLTLPLSYYQRHRTGDLMARATNDLSAVCVFFMYGLRGLAEMSLIFVFSIALMCYIDWKLALVVLLPLPLFGVRHPAHGPRWCTTASAPSRSSSAT